MFADAVARRGATLDARLAQIIPENSDHAGAHINTVVSTGRAAALRSGPEIQYVAWATWPAATATCRIVDPMLVEAAHRADSVIGNHLEYPSDPRSRWRHRPGCCSTSATIARGPRGN